MKNWNRFFSLGLGSILFILFASTAFAQGRVDKYITTTFDAEWNDISGSGTLFQMSDEHAYANGSAILSLPFDFNYDQTTVSAGSDITVSAGGAITFGDATANSVAIGNSSYPGTLGFFNGTAVVTGVADNNGNYGDYFNYDYYEVDGSGTDQVFTIQLDEMHFVGDGGGGYNTSEQSNMQIKLYKSTGVIEFIYMDHDHDFGYDYYDYNSDYTQSGVSIGLNGFTSPSFASNTYTTLVTATPSSDIRFTPPPPPAELSLQPKSLNFGTVVPAVPDTLCVTASSVGSFPLHITGYSISGSSSFTVISGPPIGTEIDPGNSVQYCIQFQPFSPGTIVDTFILSTDGADSGVQKVSLTGVGAIPTVSYGVTNLFHGVTVELGDTSAEKFIPVTSTGLGPLTFTGFTFTGLNANDYFVSRMPMSPLPAGMTDSIGVRFTPTIEGRPDASIVINTNAYNIPSDTIPFFGIGALPHLTVTVPPPGFGNTVMFDSVALGDSLCQTITLTNPGSDTLLILKQIVTYGDYDFTFYPLTGRDTILPPGATKLVNICFKPLRYGSRLASIRFYTNIPQTFETPRRDTSQILVNVTGIGVPYGQLAVRGSLNDTAAVTKTNCITDTLVNKGQSDITISKVTITPTNANFMITGAPTPFTLAPGQTKIVELCFSAMTRGTETDTLLLSGTTSDKPASEVLLLNGIGVETCVSADSLITFGSTAMTLVGVQDTSCVTVTNCGDLPATYTASTPTGTGYTLISPTTSAVIAPGGTAQFCVSFTPTSIGAVNGSISISGGPNPTTTLLGGVGAGVLASASGAPAAPVSIGDCQNFDVTITNNGNVTWTPGTPSIGGANASDFTLVSGPTPTTIAAAGTATVTIKFCPTTQGSESMTLTFPSESPVPVPGAFSFTATGVGATSGVTLRTEQDGFVLGASYPNPTSGQAAIEITLPKESNIRIDLLDATGALVRTAFSGNLAEGTQTVALDAKGLPSGTYFYMLTSDDVRLTRQMSLIK